MTTEVVLLAPVMLVLLGFVVMTGRIGEVDGAVTNAAQQAARAATLMGAPTAAHATADSTARANLESLGIVCTMLNVVVNTSRFEPGGDVAVEVTCTVDLDDVAFTGLPGDKTVHARAVEVIDTYRGAGP
ncbi:MAG: pilus assembly protein [Actinobacteria bacterium]|nr:pilus assembly protein [Actinomycetota bacterium]